MKVKNEYKNVTIDTSLDFQKFLNKNNIKSDVLYLDDAQKQSTMFYHLVLDLKSFCITAGVGCRKIFDTENIVDCGNSIKIINTNPLIISTEYGEFFVYGD